MAGVRFFADLALRPHEEMDRASAERAGAYAAAVFDEQGRAESAAMMADGEIDQVRWYGDHPSEALHARHVSRYGAVEYTACRGEPSPDAAGFMQTIWEVSAHGDVRARDVFRFVGQEDETVLEAWRYGPDDEPVSHFVYENGRPVRGVEYDVDGTIFRSIEEE